MWARPREAPLRIDLSCSKLGADGLAALGRALTPTLTSLNLEGSDCANSGGNDEGILKLFEHWRDDPSGLTELNLRDNRLSAGAGCAVAQALECSAVLTACTLVKNKLDNESANMLAKIGTEKRIMLSGIKHDQTEASFRAKGLQPSDGILIASDIRVSAALTTLNLYYNNIGPEGGKALAEALRVNAALTTLDLRENRLDAEAGKALAEALRVNAVLTTVILGNNRIGGHWDTNTSKVVHTPEGPAAIAAALRVNAVLTDLNLEKNKIGTEGAVALAEALQVNAVLTTLNLCLNAHWRPGWHCHG
jgi:Ran GTPase-activating protein (RanGAP) involved in mRNA processing and transport